MTDIRVTEALWASTMAPEGIFENWLVPDGAHISAGDASAQVRIEDALHDVLAPATGRLTTIAASNDVIEPGTVLGQIIP
jgi:pyruvate/2-oxoglutarate dehydrogenase complex dihydrolipoamide acyltransferase (E2) component